jgi:hypothetical protein
MDRNSNEVDARTPYCTCEGSGRQQQPQQQPQQQQQTHANTNEIPGSYSGSSVVVRLYAWYDFMVLYHQKAYAWYDFRIICHKKVHAW